MLLGALSFAGGMIAAGKISRLARHLHRAPNAPRRPEDVVAPRVPASARAPAGMPAAIEVSHLSKTFRIPLEANDSLIGRLSRPFDRDRYRELHVFDDVSFEVGSGEFFGIIGRNGSGKSTLLKLIASIYRADRGSIEVAGQIAPIIDLGVGFHPELAARDNVLLNGVMMGLTPEQAHERFDRIIEFAGLKDFEGLKLKNYSAGMKVRLAFAVMVEADADVMLIDEVLAVGDATFRERCYDVFRRYKELGKTVILVSHQTTRLESLCDRVMLLDAGRVERIGDPADVLRRYAELTVAGRGARPRMGVGRERGGRYPAELVELWLGGADSDHPVPVVDEDADQLTLHAVFDIEDSVVDPGLRFDIRNENDTRIFAPDSTPLTEGGTLTPGRRIHVEATIENKLMPGSYTLNCVLTRKRGRELAASDVRSTEFAVPGPQIRGRGLVALDYQVGIRREADIVETVEGRVT
jgi:ABC-type polysaccharide/polyol phosphate transport system ATPase subunit